VSACSVGLTSDAKHQSDRCVAPGIIAADGRILLTVANKYLPCSEAEVAMIRFIYADRLSDYPVLAESMFKDRAEQFKKRLEWDVTVNEDGWEVDQYDALNPIYIVWENADGSHGGSLRIMPTTGRTMTAEHFRHLTDGVHISSPLIWECTRFCLSPGASAGVAAALLAAGIELGLRFGLEQAIGVIYTKTLAIYQRIGHRPDVIGTDDGGRDSISICIWDLTEAARDRICFRAGLPAGLVGQWFDLSFAAPSAGDANAAPDLVAA
jgi:acyl homoserine lactone synthase